MVKGYKMHGHEMMGNKTKHTLLYRPYTCQGSMQEKINTDNNTDSYCHSMTVVSRLKERKRTHSPTSRQL